MFPIHSFYYDENPGTSTSGPIKRLYSNTSSETCSPLTLEVMDTKMKVKCIFFGEVRGTQRNKATRSSSTVINAVFLSPDNKYKDTNSVF